MLYTDHYLTIAASVEGLYKEKGSKFLAFAFPITSEMAVRNLLEELRKAHPKANHHCFAYRLGTDKNLFRSNDDGEPSGTAGRPLLGQIDSFGLTNVLVVAVRYFGGTKLGITGLINAYKECAAVVLRQAVVVEGTVREVHRLEFGYALMPNVMNAVKKLGISILTQNFELDCQIDIALTRSEAAQKLLELKAEIGQMPIEMMQQKTSIEGLKIAFLRVDW